MPALAKLIGIEAGAILAAAKTQTSGSRFAYYFSTIGGTFGSAPVLKVFVGGVKYQAAFSGPIGGNASGFVLPSLNAPTVNIQDALTDPAARILIEGTGAAAGRIMELPVSVLATPDKLRLAPPLDGVAQLRLSLGAMTPPTGLVNADQAPAGTVWTSAEVDAAIATSRGKNEFLIQGLAGRTDGWRGGSALSFGRLWNSTNPKSWAWETGTYPVTSFNTWIEPWFVMVCMEGTTGDGWIETRGWDFQWRKNGESQWRRPRPKSNSVRWCLDYTIGSNGNYVYQTDPTPRMPGEDGGESVKVAQGKSPHGGTGLGIFQIPDIHSGSTNNMAHCMVTCEYRRDSRSASTWRGGIHVAGDPKPTGTGDQMGMPYYIAFHNSLTAEAKNEWRRLTAWPVVPLSGHVGTRTVPDSECYEFPPLR